MGRKRTWLIAAAVVGLGVAGAAYTFSQYLLPNFSVVRRGVLWRSGQPNTLGLQVARLAGVRTIVCLRGKDSSARTAEAEFARRHGIAFIATPLPFSGVGAADVVAGFLDVVGDPARQPVLVHCARGKERSGVCSAAFRIKLNCWSNQQASVEMYARGWSRANCPPRGTRTGPLYRAAAPLMASLAEGPALPASYGRSGAVGLP